MAGFASIMNGNRIPLVADVSGIEQIIAGERALNGEIPILRVGRSHPILAN
jgi:hypothetical protein